MKLTILKGIADNLTKHLDFEVIFGNFKDTPKKIDVDILKEKDALSEHSLKFFRDRLPKTFDFNRIKEINLKMSRTENSVKIAVKVKVDDKEFISQYISLLSGY